jgi:FtsX-like permease family
MILTPGHGGLVTSQYGVLGIPAQLTLTAPITTEAIPGIATRAYMSGSQLHVGSVVPVAAGSDTSLPVRIVAAVTAFPTAAGSGQGGLIVDQAALQDQLAAEWAGPVPVTQWWLQRAASRIRLPAGAVAVTAAGTAAALTRQPLSRVQQPALLAVALAAALLAALGFSVSVAASMQERRSQNALLAALGVSRGERTRQLCLEQLLLSAPAAGAGLVLGAGLSWLLVPAVTRTGLGLPPFPPVQVHIPFLISAGLALAVTAIPVLAAAATVAYQPDPAAQLRTAETL